MIDYAKIQKQRAARRETMANPFRRKRRANQSARYLNKRETEMHRETFDRSGNRNEIRFDYTSVM